MCRWPRNACPASAMQAAAATPAHTTQHACRRPRLVGVLDSGRVNISGVTLTGEPAAGRLQNPTCLKRLAHATCWSLLAAAAASCPPARLPAAADPVYWCLHVLRSQHISIDGIIIRGDWGVPNNDGTLTPAACLRPASMPACIYGMCRCCTHPTPGSQAGTLAGRSPVCLLPAALHAGIDVDSSSHVSISHADVDTADDAICLKTTSPGHPLEHVTVSDCRWAGQRVLQK